MIVTFNRTVAKFNGECRCSAAPCKHQNAKPKKIYRTKHGNEVIITTSWCIYIYIYRALPIVSIVGRFGG